MAVAARGQLNFNEVPGGFKGVDSFEKLELLGQGTYGEVHKAKEKGTGEVVALKKLKLAKENYEVEGFPIAAIREIKILNKFHHENIIKLKEIVTSPVQNNQVLGDCGIYMVFEYMEHDLTGLVNRQGARFSVPQVKCYMKQLLMGLHYCHLNGVLHRDIKSSNLFINNQGRLKLGDFGLARNFSAEEDHQNAKLTSQVVTLWYRPPELLLGTKSYGPEVDMWSAGCIFAELLCQGRPLFNSNTEAGVLSKIVEVCGVPGEASWPGVSKLPWYETFLKNMKSQQRPLSEIFRHCDRPTLELLEKLLTLDPSKRISARDALDADYFWTDPLPCDPKSLRPYESSHELDVQNDKKKRKLQQLQDEKNVVKCQKPMQYQQPLPRGNPPPSHQKSEQAEAKEKPDHHELDIRKEHDMKRRKQQKLQDEETVAESQKSVRYQQRHSRGSLPRSHHISEHAEAREEPYRRSYSSLSPVAARPRRCYESRPPRPSYGARRYYESDRYASGRDRYSNMRDGRRNWRY